MPVKHKLKFFSNGKKELASECQTSKRQSVCLFEDLQMSIKRIQHVYRKHMDQSAMKAIFKKENSKKPYRLFMYLACYSFNRWH